MAVNTEVIIDAAQAPLASPRAGIVSTARKLTPAEERLDRQLMVAAFDGEDPALIAALQQRPPKRTKAHEDGEKRAAAKLQQLRETTAARLAEARKPGDAALAKLDGDAERYPALRADPRWKASRAQVLAARRADVAQVRSDITREVTKLVQEVEHAVGQNPAPPLDAKDMAAFDSVERLMRLDPDEGVAALADALRRNPGPELARQYHAYARALARGPAFRLDDPETASRGGLLAGLAADAADLGATQWTVARDLIAAWRDGATGEIDSLAAITTGDVFPTEQNAAFTHIDVPPELGGARRLPPQPDARHQVEVRVDPAARPASSFRTNDGLPPVRSDA